MRTSLLFLLLLLTGCASLGERQRSEALDSAVHAYALALRWGDIATLKRYRQADDPAAGRLPGSASVRITECELVQVEPAADHSTATAELKVNYYHDDAMTLRSVVDRQSWIYETGKDAWIITSPLPELR